MGRSGLPTTLAICCRLPQELPTASAEACLEVVRRTSVPVTWITTVDQLRLHAGQRGISSPPTPIALELPVQQTRQELRHLVAQATAAAPGLDAAAIRGHLPAEHRQVLIDAGIRVVCCGRFDTASRGSRRPAPHGWPCRSTLWGLWEVTPCAAAVPPGMVGRLLAWGSQPAPGPGSLSLIDIGGQGPFSADVIRSRIEQWRAWAERGTSGGRAVFAAVSDLPSLIAGASRLSEGGSVLRAA